MSIIFKKNIVFKSVVWENTYYLNAVFCRLFDSQRVAGSYIMTMDSRICVFEAQFNFVLVKHVQWIH
jgi:hypothetical protein